MTNNLEDELQRIAMSMDNQESKQEEIQDIYVLIIREQEEDQTQIVDSCPVTSQNISFLPAYALCSLYILLILSTLALQCYCVVNPLVATITIIPKSQQVTQSGTVQLGRLLPPLTVSQSQTTATTGKGHQNAKVATGYLTFYNGQQTNQTIAQGTVFTGNDGVSIETTQSATIPPGNPNTGYGTVTVTAQAVEAGSNGNIQAGDVNTPIALAVFVKNSQFTGGQDERDFSTVSTEDIQKISTPLKLAVTQSMQGALQGQLKSNEQLQLLPCTPTVTSDHQPGQEATQVKVTVSQTCSAVAYNSQELQTKVVMFLGIQAQHKTGAGYSLFGTVHVRVTRASVTSTPHPVVFLSFHTSGIWIYGLSQQSQQQIKHLISGKTTQQAGTLLASLPGVKQATIRFDGFGDATKIPKDPASIHFVLFFPAL